MKQILIILLLMSTTAQAQPFTLVGKGLGNLQIGDTLDMNINELSPISQSPVIKKLFIWLPEQFDYYFANANPCKVNAGDSSVVADIYIATNKQRVIVNIFLFVDWKELKKVTALIEEVFDKPVLGSTSGVGNETHRATKFWDKDGIYLFLSMDYSEILKISICHSSSFGKSRPDVSMR